MNKNWKAAPVIRPSLSKILSGFTILAGLVVKRADRQANLLRLLHKIERYRSSYKEYGSKGLPPIRDREPDEIKSVLFDLAPRDRFEIEKIIAPLYGDKASFTYTPRIISDLLSAGLQILEYMKKNLLIFSFSKRDKAIMKTAIEIGKSLPQSHSASYLLQAQRMKLANEMRERIGELPREVADNIVSDVDLELDKLVAGEDLTPIRSAGIVGNIMKKIISELTDETKETLGSHGS